MNNHWRLLCILMLSCSLYAQQSEYVYRNPSDSTFNCYLKIFPKTEQIKGLVIRDFTNLPDTSKQSPYQIFDLIAEAGMMTLITNTSNQFPELFASDEPMKLLDEMVSEVIEAHQIPKENIFIGGISASGARALRYAQYCAAGKSKVRIRGVFAVDSPLDLERFYHSASNHKHNFTDGMLWEANHMIPLFNDLFGGSPDEKYDDYKAGSVFTQSDPKGGNASLLKSTDLILFHEPDIDWWIHERGASYYDINSYDYAAFTVLLRSLGNESVELVTTTGKGFDRQGNRKPHSWTIVDEVYLVQWMTARLTE